MAYTDADCEVRLACCDVHVVDSQGHRTKDLAKLPYLEPMGQAAWSPNGRWIAFVDGFEGVVRVALKDGSKLRRLSPSGVDAGGPTWSPDGKWVAFEALRLADRPFTTDLYVARADGTDLRRITRTPKISEESPCGSADSHAGVAWLESVLRPWEHPRAMRSTARTLTTVAGVGVALVLVGGPFGVQRW
jgi:dipeptidyl aminopeptidase/acylaminoacyl peptidase